MLGEVSEAPRRLKATPGSFNDVTASFGEKLRLCETGGGGGSDLAVQQMDGSAAERLATEHLC